MAQTAARTPRPITVRQRTSPGGVTGWEAVTIAPIVTTHTIGLRATAEEVVLLVERMKADGNFAADAEIVVVEPEPAFVVHTGGKGVWYCLRTSDRKLAGPFKTKRQASEIVAERNAEVEAGTRSR